MVFDVEQVRKACAESFTFRVLLTRLGINPRNRNARDQLKEFMKQKDISYLHSVLFR